MIQLVIGVILIYLYYLLMKFLFKSVAPELATLEILLGVVPVFVAYGKATYLTFVNAMQLWRRVAWLLAWIFLAAMALDFASGVLVALTKSVIRGSALLNGLAPLLWRLDWQINDLFFGAIGLRRAVDLLREVHWFPALVFIVFVKSVPVVLSQFVARGLGGGVSAGDDPCVRQYFFQQAWLDLKKVIAEASRVALSIYRRALRLVPGFPGNIYAGAGPFLIAFLWPLIVTVLASLIPPLLVSMMALAVLLASHSLTVVLTMGLAMCLSGALFLMERGIIFIRSRFAKCPHAGCHEPVALPVFQCPKCGAQHRRLVPGRNGVFRRECNCGASLPTLFWLGKSKLPAYCPSCGKSMSSALFGGNVHIPIYGGPSTGKTMFMMACTWQLLEKRPANIKSDFIEQPVRKDYEARWKPNFESGVLREKTAHLLPDAFLLRLRRGSGLPISMYLYDPSGEALEREDMLAGHQFLRYYDGLALIIDPLSLPAIAEQYRQATGQEVPASTSSAHPVDIVHHIVNSLESQARLSRAKKQAKSLAVVISKADIPVVQEALGLRLSSGGNRRPWAKIGDREDQQIRSWFRKNEPALLQLLETRFARVRFFLTSALGHAPTAGEGFRPQQVLDPLLWLLAPIKTLTWPSAARGLVHSLEGALVLGLSAALVGALLYTGSLGSSLGIRALDALERHVQATARADAPVPVNRWLTNVTVSKANVRAAPATTANVIHQVLRGVELEVIARQPDWYQVLSPETGVRGWVHSSVVSEPHLVRHQSKSEADGRLAQLDTSNDAPEELKKYVGDYGQVSETGDSCTELHIFMEAGRPAAFYRSWYCGEGAQPPDWERLHDLSIKGMSLTGTTPEGYRGTWNLKDFDRTPRRL